MNPKQIEVLKKASRKSEREFANDAILLQLKEWRKQGQDHIYFGALAIHPDSDETETFGGLIDKI